MQPPAIPQILQTLPACIATICVAVITAASDNTRAPRRNILTVQVIDWNAMLNDCSYNAWFQRNLRCTQQSFRFLVSELQPLYEQRYGKPRYNRQITFDRILAVTLYYLGSAGGFREAGHALGISKGSAVLYINKLIDVLSATANTWIHFPNTAREWSAMERGFYNKRSIPNISGAIDGSLFEIQRPAAPEGWYCRKGYPSVNMQAVVNHRCQFMSFDIRPGSWSDKKIWNASVLGMKLLV